MEPKLAAGKKRLFTHGTIYIDAERTVTNLLVEDTKVIAYDVTPSDHPDAEVIDLEGAFAYPGFIDSHVHLLEVGMVFAEGVDLSSCKNADDIAQAIAKVAEKYPEASPILGAAFTLNDYDAWSLDDLAKLDKSSGSKMVLLVDNLGHNMIVNSSTMKKCHLDEKTPCPLGGGIVKQNGMLTGMLRESAMSLAGNVIFPMIPDDVVKKGAKNFFTLWSSMGYTSVVDLMGAPFGRMLRPDICRQLEEEEALSLRITYRYTCFGLHDMEGALACRGKDTDMVRFGGLKIFVDGAFAGGEAWTTWENQQGNRGPYLVYVDDTYGQDKNINRIVEQADELGLDVHYHMQGDKAIDVVLDALDSIVQKKGQLASAHTFIHLAFVTDEQMKRMKAFHGKVLATVQPAFWVVEEELSRYYGGREKTAYPIKKLIDSGISTGLSTDFRVSPLELSAPTKVIAIATSGGGDPTNHPPLTVKDAVHSLSYGSALTTGSRDLGTLDIGFKADIVVYDNDLYSVSIEDFSQNNPQVLSTWVGARRVYSYKG